MIAPLFLPHLGCGRRCTYCNQDHITGGQAAPLKERIGRLFATLARPAEVALYGGEHPRACRQGRSRQSSASSTRTATRSPPCAYRSRPRIVAPGVIALLKKYGVRTIELGAPSFNDAILARLNRGHTAEDVRSAFRLLRAQGFETGLQVMVGLPGETPDDVRETAANIVDLAPAFIRIYPLLVIEDTPLCRDFRAGRFSPDTLEAAVAKSAFIYVSAWTHGIKTIKMGLTANDVLAEKVVGRPLPSRLRLPREIGGLLPRGPCAARLVGPFGGKCAPICQPARRGPSHGPQARQYREARGGRDQP